MSKLVVKKRISLDFLGDEHKESYVVFRAIPLRDYEKYLAENDAIQKKGNNVGSIKLLVEVLQNQFIEGKTAEGDLTTDDLSDLDVDTAIKIFSYLTGQDLPPKV